MSRAILLVEMPENCLECTLSNINADVALCTATGKWIEDVYVDEDRSSFCPLIEIPKEKDVEVE